MDRLSEACFLFPQSLTVIYTPWFWLLLWSEITPYIPKYFPVETLSCTFHPEILILDLTGPGEGGNIVSSLQLKPLTNLGYN